MYLSGESTVNFIANLTPIYWRQKVDGKWAAQSMSDGTLIFAAEDTQPWDDADKLVTIWWQGDKSRQSSVPVGACATNALVEYVNFHGTGLSEKKKKDLLQMLSDHYHLKTGEHTYLPYRNDNRTLSKKILDAFNPFAKDIVVEGVKAAVGIVL